jgi:hypothetical protein
MKRDGQVIFLRDQKMNPIPIERFLPRKMQEKKVFGETIKI